MGESSQYAIDAWRKAACSVDDMHQRGSHILSSWAETTGCGHATKNAGGEHVSGLSDGSLSFVRLQSVSDCGIAYATLPWNPSRPTVTLGLSPIPGVGKL